MFALFWSLLCLIALFCILYVLLRPMVHGAIYFPTDPRRVELIMEILRPHAGQKVADIGSGDGRILIALAERGATAHGYEINPILVWRSRRAIRARGLAGRAFVHWKDFWRVDLAGFDAVVVYGFPHLMQGLQEKLQKELRPGAAVVSCVYSFPSWAPAMKRDKIYFYERGQKIEI
ncbi:MAG TPA: methyltransferase domain-containing protein [Candidatus Paceibacterota bacterium]|nr:methyltransferase domain-containing protein [Candidatus Paceibacterota bacterium]